MHIGQNLKRVADGYTLDQVRYTEALEKLHVPVDTADKSAYEEPDDFRAAVVNAPTAGDARLANATIERAQSSDVVLKFPKLYDDVELLCFADASFGNNADGTSQGGFAAVLREKNTRPGMSTGGAADASSWLKLLLTEVGLLPVTKGGASNFILQPDWVLTDAMSVREVLETTKVPREKNLLLDVQRMRTLVED
eukprot:gene17974-biopygen30072